MSEVTELRKKIEEEWIAANRALYGFASVGKHSIITHRMEKIQEHAERLEELVGHDTASQIMINVMRKKPTIETQQTTEELSLKSLHLLDEIWENKVKIEKICSAYHFDLATLAQASDVSLTTAQYALAHQPIKRQEAEKIVKGLSKITGVPWELNTIDIIVWEDSLILYMAYAGTHEQDIGLDDEFQFVYARDEAHASELLKPWSTPHEHVTFTAYPQGFVVGDVIMPGYKSPKEL